MDNKKNEENSVEELKNQENSVQEGTELESTIQEAIESESTVEESVELESAIQENIELESTSQETNELESTVKESVELESTTQENIEKVEELDVIDAKDDTDKVVYSDENSNRVESMSGTVNLNDKAAKMKMMVAVTLITLLVVVLGALVFGAIRLVPTLTKSGVVTNEYGIKNLNVNNEFELEVPSYSKANLSQDDIEFLEPIEISMGEYGETTFEGKVRNNTKNILDINLTIEVYDKDGNVIDEVFIWESIVPAGVTWKFSDYTYIDEEIAAYKLTGVTANYEDRTDDLRIDRNLRVLDEPTIIEDDYSKIITGKIQNLSGTDLTDVYLTFEMFDEDGYYLGSTLETVEVLTDQTVWSFSTPTIYDDVFKVSLSDITHYGEFVYERRHVTTDEIEIVKTLTLSDINRGDKMISGEIKNTSNRNIASGYAYVQYFNKQGELIADDIIRIEDFRINDTFVISESIFIYSNEILDSAKLLYLVVW